jgi:putative membrane protein
MQNTTVSEQDMQWMAQTVSSNLLEIRLGTVAQHVATSGVAHNFGAKMVADHSDALHQLDLIASDLGVALPHTLTASDQANLSQLSHLTGPAFDVAYMNFMVGDHTDDIASFTDEANTTANEQLRTYAQQNIPILQAHLNRAQNGATAVSALTREDRQWMKRAASGELLEIQLGSAAQSQGTDVAEFGSRMVTEHSESLELLRHIAAAVGVNLPTSLNAKDQANYDRIASLQGSDFDKAYASFMVTDHTEDVASFTQKNAMTANALLKTFTRINIPILQSHLAAAQQLDEMVNGTTPTPTPTV